MQHVGRRCAPPFCHKPQAFTIYACICSNVCRFGSLCHFGRVKRNEISFWFACVLLRISIMQSQWLMTLMRQNGLNTIFGTRNSVCRKWSEQGARVFIFGIDFSTIASHYVQSLSVSHCVSWGHSSFAPEIKHLPFWMKETIYSANKPSNLITHGFCLRYVVFPSCDCCDFVFPAHRYTWWWYYIMFISSNAMTMARNITKTFHEIISLAEFESVILKL